MRIILTGVAACAMLVAASGAKPATAMPIANIAANAAETSAQDVIPARYRHWRRYGHWGPRYRHWGPRYSYGYYPRYRPYYRRYYGPGFYIGPRGFGLRFW